MASRRDRKRRRQRQEGRLGAKASATEQAELRHQQWKAENPSATSGLAIGMRTHWLIQKAVELATTLPPPGPDAS